MYQVKPTPAKIILAKAKQNGHRFIYKYVMRGETFAHDGCHRRRLAALEPKQCSGHQPKGAAALWRQYLEEDEQHSWASLRWFMCAPIGVRWVVTETNALNTVEGSRLPWQGHTRHVKISAATTSHHLKVSGDRTAPPIQHPPFIPNGHMTQGTCMAGDVTTLHHEK